MENELQKATDVRDQWNAVGVSILENDELPTIPSCEWCKGKEADCGSKRMWAKCQICVFKDACFGFRRAKADLGAGKIDFEEFKICCAVCLEQMRKAYRENYDG